MIRTTISLMLLALAGATPAADWPMFLGDAARSNHSSETGLLQKWPEGGPPLLWDISGLGAGHSTPVVAQGVVYTIGRVGADEKRKGGKYTLSATDLRSGDLRWQVPCERVAQSTPAIAGDRLILGGTDQIYCHQLSDGQLLWQARVSELAGLDGDANQVWRKIGPTNPPNSASPLICQGLVIATPALPGVQVAALDLATGKLAWAVKDLDLDLYAPAASSALGFEVDGKPVVVAVLSDHLVGIDATTGERLWLKRMMDTSSAGRFYTQLNTPTWHDGFLVWLPGYHGKNAQAFRVEDGGRTLTRAWSKTDFAIKVKHEGAIAVDGLLYGSKGQVDGADLVAAPEVMVQGAKVKDYPEDWLKAWPRRPGCHKFPPHGAKSDFGDWTAGEWKGHELKGCLVAVDVATGELRGLRFGANLSAHCGHLHLYADGRLYSGPSGTLPQLLLIEPGPAMRVCGRLVVPEHDKVGYPSPVVADKLLLIRLGDRLLAYDIARK